MLQAKQDTACLRICNIFKQYRAARIWHTYLVCYHIYFLETYAAYELHTMKTLIRLVARFISPKKICFLPTIRIYICLRFWTLAFELIYLSLLALYSIVIGQTNFSAWLEKAWYYRFYWISYFDCKKISSRQQIK